MAKTKMEERKKEKHEDGNKCMANYGIHKVMDVALPNLKDGFSSGIKSRPDLAWSRVGNVNIFSLSLNRNSLWFCFLVFSFYY